MREKPDERLEAGRVRDGRWNSERGAMYGAFELVGPCGRSLRIMSSGKDDEFRWEHVSVSLEGKHPPNWQEMCWVKDHFWQDEETVVQYHPKKSVYKNVHPNCLHLWRKVDGEFELPPRMLV